jgi:hypothetical protein
LLLEICGTLLLVESAACQRVLQPAPESARPYAGAEADEQVAVVGDPAAQAREEAAGRRSCRRRSARRR